MELNYRYEFIKDNQKESQQIVEARIKNEIGRIQAMLIEKNKQYGNSVQQPANIFAKGSPVENICARIDDKLMRIANSGVNENTIDTVDDLIGYLIHLRIAYNAQNNI